MFSRTSLNKLLNKINISVLKDVKIEAVHDQFCLKAANIVVVGYFLCGEASHKSLAGISKWCRLECALQNIKTH